MLLGFSLKINDQHNRDDNGKFINLPKCGSDKEISSKRRFQFGGDFGGPLLKGVFCLGCLIGFHSDERDLEAFQKEHPEKFSEWSL